MFEKGASDRNSPTGAEGSVTAHLGVRDFEIHWISRGFRISEWISGFQSGFLDFKWISGFQSGFLDFWISQWISGFQFGFLPTVYEISFVTDPSTGAYGGSNSNLSNELTLSVNVLLMIYSPTAFSVLAADIYSAGS